MIYGFLARDETSPAVLIDKNESVPLLNKGKAIRKQWSTESLLIRRKSGRTTDFIFSSVGPAFSARARDVLAPLFGDSVEWLQLITIRKTDYFVINVLEPVDCIDYSRSRVLYSDDEHPVILMVSQIVFDETKLPKACIFVAKHDHHVYVSEAVVDAIRKNHLTGACFFDPAANILKLSYDHIDLNIVPYLPL